MGGVEGVEGVEGDKGVENRDICARMASWNMANNCGIFIRSRMMSREYMHRVFTLNHNQTGRHFSSYHSHHKVQRAVESSDHLIPTGSQETGSSAFVFPRTSPQICTQ